jgi:hypothetical protein
MPQWAVITFLVLGQVFSHGHGPMSRATAPSPGDRTVSLISISIMPPDQVVSIGSTAFYRAIGVFSDGTTADLTSSLTWTVLPAGGSQVIGPGSIHTQAAGSVMVLVESGEMRGTASLQVR